MTANLISQRDDRTTSSDPTFCQDSFDKALECFDAYYGSCRRLLDEGRLGTAQTGLSYLCITVCRLENQALRSGATVDALRTTIKAMDKYVGLRNVVQGRTNHDKKERVNKMLAEVNKCVAEHCQIRDPRRRAILLLDDAVREIADL